MKKLANLLLVACLAVSAFQGVVTIKADQTTRELRNLNLTGFSATEEFFEDFGDDPNGVVDTNVWHHQAGSPSSVMLIKRDPEATDAQNGKGYSFYTDGAQKSFIEHSFDNLIRGKVTVQFYDDGLKQNGRMAQVNLTGAANAQNANKPFTIGLGINQNTATQGWSNDNYAARIADDGRFIDTGVVRSKGWHTFVLECSEEGTSLWIDDTKIDTSSIPEKDIVTSFQNVQIGDKWGKGGETYFDNVHVENISVVDVAGEEAAKKDATLSLIRLDEFKMSEFDKDKTEYTWYLTANDALPVVSAEATNPKAKVEITQATKDTNKATIQVTAVDGTTTQEYTITFAQIIEIAATWADSFESGDTSLWETLDSRGTYTKVDTTQAHEGTHSFVTEGTASTKSWIFKKFDQPVTGKISVWFYDTMGTPTYQQVNVWAPFEDVSNQPVMTGLAVQGSKSVYVVRMPGNSYQDTTIARSEGWHEFVFDVTSGSKAVFFIDDQKVYETNLLTSLGALQMGDIWSTNGAKAYYDDITMTNLKAAVTGIMLNQEKISVESGKTVQLTSKILPVNADSDVVWSSANEKVATVDQNGLVTAGKVMGTTTITATTVKGNFSISCEVSVTRAPQQDATLKNIRINGEDLKDFSLSQTDYTVSVLNGKVPTVTVETSQPNATVTIKNATSIPGETVIEVTAPDGVSKMTYTIQFVELQDIFFDDFTYTDTEDLEKNGNWDVQEGTGRRPGNRNWWWSADNVVLMKDEEDETNTFVRLKAKTDGTGGENTSQSQIRYYEEKFGAGVYVARVKLYDNVMECPDPIGTGSWNAKDQALSTFFTINRIQAPKWEPYHESDFEYLFNGGWGGPAKTMWFTSWNSYSLETSSQGQKNQVTTNNNQTKSLEGDWITLTIKLDEDGRTTYYIDGEQKASHANKDKLAGPQSIAFNLWFINGTQAKGSQRTYWEDVDWIYYTPDTTMTTQEIVDSVTEIKGAGINKFDDISSPDISLETITIDGKPLEGFSNDQCDYTIELPYETRRTPRVEASANNQWTIIDITPASELPGTTTVYVQSSDLSVTKTFHLNFTVEGRDGLLAPLSNFASGSSVKYRDVILYHPNETAEIYYTMDGTTPTSASTKYDGKPIRIEESTNIKAIACVDGQTSPVADFLYTVIPLTPQVSPHPVANLQTGTYEGPQYLELTVPESSQYPYEVAGRTDNYKIYYTTDGTIPTTNQYAPNPSTKLYTGPIRINETTTINYTAVLPGISESYEDSVANKNKYSRVTITISSTTEKDHTIQIGDLWNGTITADQNMADEGDTIHLTITPDEGYELKAGTLRVNDRPITGTSFVMPDEDVIITAEFRDNVNPVITGVEDGKHYCENQTITVTDENLKSLSVDGSVVELDEKGNYVLTEGEHVIVAEDYAHNTTTFIVTIGHDVRIDAAVPATCEKDGLTEGKHCERCGKILVKQEVISALGHEYEEGSCIRCGEKDPDYTAPVTPDNGDNNNGNNSVNTADTMNMTLWIACLGFVLIVIASIVKSKKESETN